MKRKSFAAMIGAVVVLTVALLVAIGCGGGGPSSPNSPATLTAQFQALLPAVQKSATRVGAAACANCHTALHTGWMATAHAAALVDCESCHGPGSAHIANPVAATILSGVASTSSVVCGQCHSQEHSDWSNSMHAQIVADAVSADSSTCLRCHSGQFRPINVDEPISHGETPTQVNTAILALSTSTLTSYATQTTTSATCTSCHDPHENTTNLTSAANQYYLRRATSNTDLSSDQPGASVALYTTVNQICGSCHNNRGGNPALSALQTPANTTRPATHEGPEYNMLLGYGGSEDSAGPPVRTSSHASVPDQCMHCHMPNASHTMVVSVDVSCAPCHTAAAASSTMLTLQTQTNNALVALRTRMENWSQATYGNPNLWDYTTNITAPNVAPSTTVEAGYPPAILVSRHNYYFILLDRSAGIHNYIYSNYLLNYSNTLLDGLPTAAPSPEVELTKQAAAAILNADIQKVKAANASLPQ